jgi:hypothetical protein
VKRAGDWILKFYSSSSCTFPFPELRGLCEKVLYARYGLKKW